MKETNFSLVKIKRLIFRTTCLIEARLFQPINGKIAWLCNFWPFKKMLGFESESPWTWIEWERWLNLLDRKFKIYFTTMKIQLFKIHDAKMLRSLWIETFFDCHSYFLTQNFQNILWVITSQFFFVYRAYYRGLLLHTWARYILHIRPWYGRML